MPVPSQLRSAASRVYRNSGYGDVYWNESTGGVYYCTGDWYPSDKVRESKALLSAVPGVKSVQVEAETRPTPREAWVKIETIHEITTSGGVGGFQTAAIGPNRKFRSRADRFHYELKKALGQLGPAELLESPMSTHRSPILDRIDRSLAALGEGRGDYESVQKYEGYWIAVSADTQRSDGKPFFVNVYAMDPRDFHNDAKMKGAYKDGFRTTQQAITWARGEINRGDIPFKPHDDYGNPIEEGAWDKLDDDATELRIFIDNDADLYRGQFTSIIKNLMTKIGQGKYDRTLAVKLFMYLVDAGAQKYTKEYGGAGTKWHDQFPKKTRELVAASLRDTFEIEASLGNYNNLLPAKYGDTDVAAILKSKGAVTESFLDGADIVPGIVLVSTWGYDQTNVDFFKVLEVKGDFAKIVQIGSKQSSDGPQTMTGTAVPNESVTSGAPMRRKIARHGKSGLVSDAVKITSYAYARPWNGKPVQWTGYA